MSLSAETGRKLFQVRTKVNRFSYIVRLKSEERRTPQITQITPINAAFALSIFEALEIEKREEVSRGTQSPHAPRIVDGCGRMLALLSIVY